MPDHHSPELKLVDDTSWSELGIDPHRIDPGIRLVASLIDAGDAQQLFRRTGMRMQAGGKIENPSLPLFVEIGPEQRSRVLEDLAGAKIESQGYSLSFAPAYLKEAERNQRMRIVPARLAWSQGPVVAFTESGVGLRRAVARLLGQRGVQRLALPNPLQPALEASLGDMEMPANRTVSGRKLTGNGVIVGVIDDGCALAHPNFLRPGTLKSRILFLWDQAGATPPNGAPYWSPPGNFPGRELTGAKIDAVLAACAANGRIDEERVYDTLGYDVALSAHGTHVLDIAAGNGASLMGSEGVANEADIVFVQLPRDLVDQGGAVLESHILDGVQYVFDRAASKNKQAVVNISFGGYCGPHDGSSRLATGMDELLQAMRGRAVVVSAGNGYEADCHATGTLNAGDSQDKVWLLRPEDPTSNQLEIWYDGAAQLELLLRPPGRAVLQPPVGLNQWKVIRRASDNRVIGWIQHENVAGTGAGSNVIRINLGSTVGEDGSLPKGAGPGNQQQAMPPPPPLAAPVPSGAWTVRLRNPAGNPTATYHAWIERDDIRGRRGRRGQQSRFLEADADATSTVADLGTGRLVICVGGHNTATSQMCRYSACGPTRDGRPKPDLTAPAEETATGGGVLCASARRARPARMGGTSAAAPHVAGLVALIMQITDGARLTADRILKRLTDGANAARTKAPPPARGLLHNTHQEVDAHRTGRRQSGHFAAVTGAGKVNAPESTR
ncbi:MAG TPA: S8 family serine peptidase [Usitatibacter sp.]|nr:S8 family serine peptidase [Usitatibacter sp.]